MIVECPTPDRTADPTGRSTMSSALPGASNYHDYVYESLRPYLGRRVWEIGSGCGQYTDRLLADGRAVLASDIDPDSVRALRERAATDDHLSAAFVDLYDRRSLHRCLEWAPDSILCLNVIEHIATDRDSLLAIAEKAPEGTVAVFLAPAFRMLYGFMDAQAGHYRRYTRATLGGAFAAAGWDVRRTFYLNPVGGVGWFVQNRLLARRTSDLDSPAVNGNIEFFDRYCVPATRLLDRVTSRFFGQSVVCVARAPAGSGRRS